MCRENYYRATGIFSIPGDSNPIRTRLFSPGLARNPPHLSDDGTPSPVPLLYEVFQTPRHCDPQEVLPEKSRGRCAEPKGCCRTAFQPRLYGSYVTVGHVANYSYYSSCPQTSPPFTGLRSTDHCPESSTMGVDPRYHGVSSTTILWPPISTFFLQQRQP